jgi:ATP-dependent Lon protease
MIVPLFVNRDKSAKAVDQALADNNRMILLVAQKTPNADDPRPEDLHQFGTVSVIMRMLKLPDGRVRILVQGFSRAKVEYYDDSKAWLTAKVHRRRNLRSSRKPWNWKL